MGRRPHPPRNLTSVRIGDAAHQFLVDVASDPLVAESTVERKRQIMRAMIDNLGPDREVWTLTDGDLNRVRAGLMRGETDDEYAARKAINAYAQRRTGRRTPESKEQAEVALRGFVKFCHQEKWLDRDVYLKERIVKAKTPRTINGVHEWRPEGFVRIPPERWPDILRRAGRIHARTRMAVALLAYGGRRVSDIILLQWGGVDLDSETITFWNSKVGRPIPPLPISPQLRAELDLWRAWAEELHGPVQSDWFLVPNRHKTIKGTNMLARVRAQPWLFPVTMTEQSRTETVQRDVRKVFDELGLPRGENTHTFRRSHGTAIYNSLGVDEAQESLDHSIRRNTQDYTGTRKASDRLSRALRDGSAFAPLPATNVGPAEAEPSAQPEAYPDNVIPLFRGAALKKDLA